MINHFLFFFFWNKILNDITGNLDAKKACYDALKLQNKYLSKVCIIFQLHYVFLLWISPNKKRCVCVCAGKSIMIFIRFNVKGGGEILPKVTNFYTIIFFFCLFTSY